MSNSLETAEQPEKLNRVVIEPLTRVEGHGKVTLLQDDNNTIQQARLHIVALGRLNVDAEELRRLAAVGGGEVTLVREQ